MWKTGVCWCTLQGVKVLVDVLDEKQVVALVQAHKLSFAVLELQSLVIQIVRDAVSEFCPKIVTQEFFVSPSDVTYPLTTTTHYSLESVAHSIVNQHEYVVSTSINVKLPVSYLLPIEVYANLGENILQALFNENDQAHNSVARTPN